MEEWSPSPVRVFNDYDYNTTVYDKVRFFVASLDPDPAQWVTPRKGGAWWQQSCRLQACAFLRPPALG
eukprot:CAMPEP_0119327692 /NCGR_PEP_ID=MMETSP1333-20130426/71454_1 /TAXON_ID=418940 /ORGANISM="Scyphosphaera apsteinii, Strain RCC1455" /LENGTH=67 /DNA_ID=CAMNT_0007336361 /DNA_START=101 /DNA_END=304 /DNA_ORIENTATION=+